MHFLDLHLSFSPVNLSNNSEARETFSLRNIRHEEALPEHIRPGVLINDYLKLVRNSTR